MLEGPKIFICMLLVPLVSQFVLQFGQQAFDMAGVTFVSQAPRELSRGSSPEWLHMQIGGNFDRSA